MHPDARHLAEGVLLTDAYQLTMAQLYFRHGMHETPAQFDHFFRSYPDYGPHQAGYCVAAGLEPMIDWIEQVRFDDAAIAVLADQTDSQDRPLFGDDFLGWLRAADSFAAIDIRAVDEGRVVHPNVPIAELTGPLALVQILETAWLNSVNFQTLIATKASRVADAARGRPVLEFGLRRSAEHGGVAATRAALVGGARASSNVGASHLAGVAPQGTHAHSMVQAFMAAGEGEVGAFRAYARTYPDDCLLLVDTVDTLASGVPNAITVFDELRATGHRPVGVRLDSGDLAHLAVRTAALLDEAGHGDTTIVLSSDLDELVILQILTQIEQEAPGYGLDPAAVIGRLSFGVGSKLVTSAGAPFLGGVYKLVALHTGGRWEPAIKVSDTPAKLVNPGRKNVHRVYDHRGTATADLLSLADEHLDPGRPLTLRHPSEPATSRTIDAGRYRLEPLLRPVRADGATVTERVPLHELRRRRDADLERLDPGVRRVVNPHRYHVSLTAALHDDKQRLIAEARGN